MKTTNQIEKRAKDYFSHRNAEIRTTRELDERILGAALVAQENSGARLKKRRILVGTFLGWAAIPLAAVILLWFLLVPLFSSRAWAIEQTIKALQKYKAVHMTGSTTVGGGPAPSELWARADAAGTGSDVCLLTLNNYTAWVRDGKTYVYDPTNNTVWVSPAITIGIGSVFAPELFTRLSKLPDYRAIEGDDPATGQKRIIVTASFTSSSGPHSFYIELDARTKLPVELKHWPTLNRHGAPEVSFEKIIYFENLPDSVFEFRPPANVSFVDRPLTIPETNVEMLTNPEDGISAEGLTQDEACRKILEQLWAAVIRKDIAQFRRLCPIASKWPDGLLQGPEAPDDAREVVEIGPVEKEGHSRLGPIALVPCQIRCRDGKVRQIKMIVQFRETDRGRSCVVHGNYGLPLVLEQPGRK